LTAQPALKLPNPESSILGSRTPPPLLVSDASGSAPKAQSLFGRVADPFRSSTKRIAPLPDGFLATFTEASVFRSTGLAYSSPIVIRFKVADDQIVSLFEYYDPIAVLRALGWLT